MVKDMWLSLMLIGSILLGVVGMVLFNIWIMLLSAVLLTITTTIFFKHVYNTLFVTNKKLFVGVTVVLALCITMFVGSVALTSYTLFLETNLMVQNSDRLQYLELMVNDVFPANVEVYALHDCSGRTFDRGQFRLPNYLFVCFTSNHQIGTVMHEAGHYYWRYNLSREQKREWNQFFEGFKCDKTNYPTKYLRDHYCDYFFKPTEVFARDFSSYVLNEQGSHATFFEKLDIKVIE